MKLKKIMATILAVMIFMLQFSFLTLNTTYAIDIINTKEASTREAKNNISIKYFYNQLTDEAKKFYDAMETMYTTELLEKGNESYDLVENEVVTQEQLASYASGSQQLLYTMGAARDAFVGDHAEIFYVDFEHLSIRVTKSGENYHATLGTGRSDSYYNKKFTNEVEVDTAIAAVNERVEQIANAAKEIKADVNQNLREQQIRYVHDEIIKNATYKYEDEAVDPYNVRTVYGAFVTKEIVCEGFARGFKMVLDKLDIPCILVTGVYKHGDNELEPHMWTYVQLDDGKWYAVDPTFDNTDTVLQDETEENVSTEYFLVGDDKLSSKHIPTGIMSPSEYQFSYPTLETTSDKYDMAYNTDGLVVEIDDESYDERDDTTAAKFKISYKNMGYKKAAQNGYYIIGNFHQYYPGNDTWLQSGWSYFRTDMIDENGKETGLYGDSFKESEDGTYFSFYMSHCKYIELAVTTIPPKQWRPGMSNIDEIEEITKYKGTPASMIVMTDKIYNPNGNYVSPPCLKKATPIVNSTMYIGTTYHCTLEYDDVLVPTGEEIGIIWSTEKSSNPEKNNFKVENFEFDGESTFSFDFTPSEMFADDSIFYNMKFTGVVGSRSQKPPMVANYFCAHRCAAYAYKSQGIDFNVFGKPSLLEDIDASTIASWSDNGVDGEISLDVAEKLKHRLALVVTKTTPQQENEMESKLKEQLNVEEGSEEGNILSSETYNINLTLCKKQIVKTGDGVRVSLGFPPGYGPDDAGVTFIAYHFNKDEQGNITSVEEIPCEVTEYGLIVTCKSFSPFTIAAVNKEPDEKNTKTVTVLSGEGGNAKTAEGDTHFELEKGKSEEKEITITPEKGYEIDEIVIGKTPQKIQKNEKGSKTITINYDELENDSNIIKVFFATESVHQKDEGEVVAQPVVAQPSFITSLTTSNTVSAQKGEFDVTVGVDQFNNVGTNGISGLSGLLEYDKEKLEVIDIKGSQEKDEVTGVWKISNDYNNENFKFVAKSSEGVKGTSEVFTIKFRVKEDAEIGTTSIQLKSVEGGSGVEEIGTINAMTDSQISIDITKPEVPAEIELTDEIYSIDEKETNFITKIAPNTTVEEFKKHVHEKNDQKMIFTKTEKVEKEDKTQLQEETKILNENDIIGTGTKLTVGRKTYILIVPQDVDGNGITDINDATIIKLYLLEKKEEHESYTYKIEELAGARFKGANPDYNDIVDINDFTIIWLAIRDSLKR